MTFSDYGLLEHGQYYININHILQILIILSILMVSIDIVK